VARRGTARTLRLEYRSKLLNPKWAAAMAAQGSGGAFEISQRMTAMVGWGATVKFAEVRGAAEKGRLREVRDTMKFPKKYHPSATECKLRVLPP